MSIMLKRIGNGSGGSEITAGNSGPPPPSVNPPEGKPDVRVIPSSDRIIDSRPVAFQDAESCKTPLLTFPEAWGNGRGWPSTSISTAFYQPSSPKLLVPSFWDSPNPNAISHSNPSSFYDGEPTISVMMASYRDYECPITITDALAKATHPTRLRFGVIEQSDDSVDISCTLPDPAVTCDIDPTQLMCIHKERIDVFKMKAADATGPVFARHVGARLYRGEFYSMQIDAHVFFVKGWDEDIIQQFNSLNNEMAVLSTYLTDIEGSLTEDGTSLRDTRPIMCNTDFEGGQIRKHLRHGSQPEGVPTITMVPQLQPYWAAGFSFARGHFTVRVPYDPYLPMTFQGEEISIGLRGFTYGYDFYAPLRSVSFHVYAIGKNANKRKKVKMFWENGNQHAGSAKSSMSRLLGLAGMAPELKAGIDYDTIEAEKYGLGSVRDVSQFFKMFGIDVVHKKAAKKLCMFVSTGNMHRRFHETFLRPPSQEDIEQGLLGGGIDYGLVGDFKIPALVYDNKK